MKLTGIVKTSITEQMVEHYYPRAVIESDQKQLKKIAYDAAVANIPAEITKAFKKTPGYFKKDNEVKFCGKSSSDWYSSSVVRVLLDEELPCAESFHALPHNEDARKLADKIDEFIQKRKELSIKISRVLDSCTTTKQVSEVLPEAVPFFPADSAAGLPVPVEAFEQLRKELARIGTGKK